MKKLHWFPEELGEEIDEEGVVVVSTCNFPSGIWINCWPGLKPRTLTFPSGPLIIWTLCCCGAGEVTLLVVCVWDVFCTAGGTWDWTMLLVVDVVVAVVVVTVFVALSVCFCTGDATVCWIILVVPSAFLTITRRLPIICAFAKSKIYNINKEYNIK